MFHNILVAIDGSASAEEALSQAVDLARREHSRLTIMTGEVQLPTGAYLAVAGVALPLVADSQAEAQQVLRRALEKVPPDLPVTTILTDQPICRALLAQIETAGHDLLVLGARTRGTLRLTLLNALGRRLRRAPIPMLIVGCDGSRQLTGSAEAGAGRRRPRRIWGWEADVAPAARPAPPGPAPASH
jgi:nucleotide-binding universal stress UspA family protein